MIEIRLSPVFIIYILSSSILANSLVSNDWVVVVSVSKWYDDIFYNWLLWYKRLDLKMNTIVIAEDIATYEKYSNNSDFTVHSEHWVLIEKSEY